MLADAYVAILIRHMVTRHFFRCGFLAFRECVAAFVTEGPIAVEISPSLQKHLSMQHLYIVCVCSSDVGQLEPAAPKLGRFLRHRFLLRLLFLPPVLLEHPLLEKATKLFSPLDVSGVWWERKSTLLDAVMAAGCNGCSDGYSRLGVMAAASAA